MNDITASYPIVSRRLASHEPINVVAYGDSISEVGRHAGYYGGASCAAKNWVHQLCSRLNQQYSDHHFDARNFAHGGHNAYEALGRQHWLQLEEPHLVLLALGTNDAGHYHPIPPEATYTALSTMCEWIRDRNHADVAIIGFGGCNPQVEDDAHLVPYVEVHRRVAERFHLLFIDTRTAMLKATDNGHKWGEYHIDDRNVHPNDNGHKVWADAAYDELIRLFS